MEVGDGRTRSLQRSTNTVRASVTMIYSPEIEDSTLARIEMSLFDGNEIGVRCMHPFCVMLKALKPLLHSVLLDCRFGQLVHGRCCIKVLIISNDVHGLTMPVGGASPVRKQPRET